MFRSTGATAQSVYLASGVSSNLLFNNIFNGDYSITTTLNSLSQSLTPGTNIIKGENIGGNFWTNAFGNGFSDSCDDSSEPYGICDNQYQLAADNIDYFPLTLGDSSVDCSEMPIPGLSANNYCQALGEVCCESDVCTDQCICDLTDPERSDTYCQGLGLSCCGSNGICSDECFCNSDDPEGNTYCTGIGFTCCGSNGICVNEPTDCDCDISEPYKDDLYCRQLMAGGCCDFETGKCVQDEAQCYCSTPGESQFCTDRGAACCVGGPSFACTSDATKCYCDPATIPAGEENEGDRYGNVFCRGIGAKCCHVQTGGHYCSYDITDCDCTVGSNPTIGDPYCQMIGGACCQPFVYFCTADPVACGGSIPTCTSTSDCTDPASQFCEFTDCTETTGYCIDIPADCTNAPLQEVCGCDGITYNNDCERRMAQESKDYDGPCEEGGDDGEIVWEGQIGITEDSANSYAPVIAVDPSQNIFIVWEDGMSGGWEIYLTKLDNNGNLLWDADSNDPSDHIKMLSETSSVESRYPDVAVDSSGNVHVVWREDVDSTEGGSYEIYYKKFDTDGNVLIGDTRLTDGDDSIHPALDVDSDGYVHVAWQDYLVDAYEIYYTHFNTDGAFVSDVGPIEALSPEGADSSKPDIILDNDYVHVVWQDRLDGDYDIYYTKLDINGDLIWDIDPNDPTDHIRAITTDSAQSQKPAVAIDSDNRVHLTWQSSGEILYKKIDEEGLTLVETAANTQAAASEDPTIALSSASSVHIAWSDYMNGQTEIYYSKVSSTGELLVEDERLTDATSYSSRPSMAIDSQGSVHITWDDRRDGNFEIYYMRGSPIQAEVP